MLHASPLNKIFTDLANGLCVLKQCLLVTTVVVSSLSHVQLFGTWRPASLLCPWDFPGNNTRVGCHCLLQGSSRFRDQTHVSCVAGLPLSPQGLIFLFKYVISSPGSVTFLTDLTLKLYGTETREPRGSQGRLVLDFVSVLQCVVILIYQHKIQTNGYPQKFPLEQLLGKCHYFLKLKISCLRKPQVAHIPKRIISNSLKKRSVLWLPEVGVGSWGEREDGTGWKWWKGTDFQLQNKKILTM